MSGAVSGAVILAAGAGRRLGGVCKATLTLADGRAFLRAICDTGRAAGVSAWVVVAGPPHERTTRAIAEELGLPVVRNPAPERGMSSSVALGFEYALGHFAGLDSALLWPVDHPRVRTTSVRAIVAQCRPARAVIARYRGRGGHPSAFGRRIWPALAACADAPQGARTVIAQLAEAGEEPGARARDDLHVYRPFVDDPGLIADVDTPEELAELTAAATAGAR